MKTDVLLKITSLTADYEGLQFEESAEGRIKALKEVKDDGRTYMYVPAIDFIDKPRASYSVTIYRYLLDEGVWRFLEKKTKIADDTTFVDAQGNIVTYEQSHNEDGSLKPGYTTEAKFFENAFGPAFYTYEKRAIENTWGI